MDEIGTTPTSCPTQTYTALHLVQQGSAVGLCALPCTTLRDPTLLYRIVFVERVIFLGRGLAPLGFGHTHPVFMPCRHAHGMASCLAWNTSGKNAPPRKQVVGEIWKHYLSDCKLPSRRCARTESNDPAALTYDECVDIS